MYDYFLGGSHNFTVDRHAARRMIEVVPDAPLMAQSNRAFLRRVVRYLTRAGITQFLDLGSGIPSVGNVHEIAPEATVLYVDLDPIAIAHGREILTEHPRVTAVEGDLRRPESILAHPELRRLIDFDRPIAVLLIAVLHFVPDADDPAGVIGQFRDALVPGSYLALSHVSPDDWEPRERRAAESIYRRTASPLAVRDRREITRLFEGFELVYPGVVRISDWHPDPGDLAGGAARTVFLGGLGRLPPGPPNRPRSGLFPASRSGRRPSGGPGRRS